VIVRSHKRAHRQLAGFALNDAQRIAGAGTLDVDAEMGFTIGSFRAFTPAVTLL
jgi:hypothetical protein